MTALVTAILGFIGGFLSKYIDFLGSKNSDKTSLENVYAKYSSQLAKQVNSLIIEKKDANDKVVKLERKVDILDTNNSKLVSQNKVLKSEIQKVQQENKVLQQKIDHLTEIIERNKQI